MFFLALGLSLASWMASPQRAAVQLPVTLDAQFAGRVVDAVSRTPIADATVMLVPTVREFPPGAINTTAVTDANGEFSIQPLPRGRYRIYVQKTGFARVTDPSNAQTIDVAAGQSVTDVELALHAGAVIAGRILGASGGPAPLFTVSALRQRTGPDGTTLATTAQMAETNDRGEFRLEGLDEGNYLVIAAPHPTPFAPPTPHAVTWAPTYYSGTRDRETAQVLSVGAGQVVDDLQFSLILLPAHEVSGVIVDEAGVPLAGVIVALMADPTKGGTATPATGLTDQHGAFRIGGIVSGSYHLMPGAGGPPVAGGGPTRNPGVGAIGGVFFGSVAPLEVTVGDTDVRGLRIVLPHPQVTLTCWRAREQCCWLALSLSLASMPFVPQPTRRTLNAVLVAGYVRRLTASCSRCLQNRRRFRTAPTRVPPVPFSDKTKDQNFSRFSGQLPTDCAEEAVFF